MIIVSQSKNIIANFENITSLNTERCNAEYYVTCNFVNKNNVFLGEYKTQERAKEVLQDIARFYRMCKGMENCSREVQVGIAEQIKKDEQDLYVYKMPED